MPWTVIFLLSSAIVTTSSCSDDGIGLGISYLEETGVVIEVGGGDGRCGDGESVCKMAENVGGVAEKEVRKKRRRRR
jgi:hypothetical protein